MTPTPRSGQWPLGLGVGGAGKGEASPACSSVLEASQCSNLPPREGQRIFPAVLSSFKDISTWLIFPPFRNAE